VLIFSLFASAESIIHRCNFSHAKKNGTGRADSINQLSFMMFKPLDTTRNAPKPVKMLQDLNRSRYIFKGKRFIIEQFTIMHVFSITTNKSKEQTISKEGAFISQHVFSHGQPCAALSRRRLQKHLNFGR
jgi:hypothetical protein